MTGLTLVFRLRLRLSKQAYKKLQLASLQKKIQTATTKLEGLMSKWRREQQTIMPQVTDLVEEQAAVWADSKIEEEVLYLPSDLNQVDRETRHLVAMGEKEAKLREGAAFDALKRVKVCAKAVVTLGDRKKKNWSGVSQNTIALKQIMDTERWRDTHIAGYMLARKAMIALGYSKGIDGDFPVLTVADTYMKSRATPRCLGDLKKTDGPIWAQGAVGVGAKIPPSLAGPSTSASLQPLEGRTVMQKRSIGV